MTVCSNAPSAKPAQSTFDASTATCDAAADAALVVSSAPYFNAGTATSAVNAPIAGPASWAALLIVFDASAVVFLAASPNWAEALETSMVDTSGTLTLLTSIFLMDSRAFEASTSGSLTLVTSTSGNLTLVTSSALIAVKDGAATTTGSGGGGGATIFAGFGAANAITVANRNAPTPIAASGFAAKVLSSLVFWSSWDALRRASPAGTAAYFTAVFLMTGAAVA